MDPYSHKKSNPSNSRSKKHSYSHLNNDISIKDEKLSKNHQPIGPSEVDELFAARDKLKDFAEKLG